MAAMMRSLSSCLDATRKWRSTERASLEKKPSTRLSQEPCLGVKVNSKRPPSLGLFGDVRRMIVEDQLDRRMGRIGGIEELEKFDEFATAMAVPDEGVNLTGEQIDAGQQTDRAVALVLVIAREGRMPARLGRKVWGRGGDRLDTGLLVIGDDRHRIARFLFGGRRSLFDELHLAIDAQNFRHLLLEFGIAAFQVIADLVRLYLLLIEYLAHRPLNQLGKAGVPLRRPMLARMASQQSRRPQLVRIAQFLRLAAGQRDKPSLGFSGDRRLLARSRAIVQRRQRTIGHRPLNAALNRLMMHSHCLTHREERWVFPVGQQHPRPLHPDRWFRSRARYRAQRCQIRVSDRQLNRSPPCCHDFPLPESTVRVQAVTTHVNPAQMISSMESMN